MKFAFVTYNVGLLTTISAWAAMPEVMNLSPSPSVSWLDSTIRARFSFLMCCQKRQGSLLVAEPP